VREYLYYGAGKLASRVRILKREGASLTQNNRIVKDLSPRLNEKEVRALLALMKDGRLKDSKLKEILGFRSENSAAYYRKRLEKAGIIERL
jgi:predicted transcriptional regulator